MITHKISRFIEKEGLFKAKDKILIALSGGADSVALLHILIRTGYTCEALHCNFHLRGEESDRDELFVKNLCQRLSIPLHIIHFTTSQYAEEKHISIEMAARELRYNWFEEKRKELKAKVIAVAHHRDDSVETFLLNLIRGTGINGLRGIMPKNQAIVRPLLEVSRKELINYLNSIGETFVTDSTNLQDDYTRNKIRLNILPLMEEINPSVKESIADTATKLSDVEKIYRKEINQSINRVRDEKGIIIEALQSEIVPKSVLFEILYPLGFNESQVNEIQESLSGQSGKVFLSSKWKLVKDRTHLLLQPKKDGKSDQHTYIEINKEGGVYRLENDKQLTLKFISINADFKINKSKDTASLDASKLQFPLIVRKWKQGDYFIPFGMKGKKKISDYLTDQKYSLLEKEEVYVVCSNNEIVWVIGERSDNRFRIDNSTQQIVILKVNT